MTFCKKLHVDNKMYPAYDPIILIRISSEKRGEIWFL